MFFRQQCASPTCQSAPRKVCGAKGGEEGVGSRRRGRCVGTHSSGSQSLATSQQLPAWPTNQILQATLHLFILMLEGNKCDRDPCDTDPSANPNCIEESPVARRWKTHLNSKHATSLQKPNTRNNFDTLCTDNQIRKRLHTAIDGEPRVTGETASLVQMGRACSRQTGGTFLFLPSPSL